MRTSSISHSPSLFNSDVSKTQNPSEHSKNSNHDLFIIKETSRNGTHIFYFDQSGKWRKSERQSAGIEDDSSQIKGAKNGPWARLERAIREFFLPSGYPRSVSKDYWPFQKWSLISGMASSASHVLATQCLLAAVGVGAAATLPVSAGVAWVLKDGLGAAGTMLVAGRFSRRFDVDPKRIRWYPFLPQLVAPHRSQESI
jgi:hypothetical protein